MTNPDNKPWQSLDAKPGALVRINISKSTRITRDMVAFYCETIKSLRYPYQRETFGEFGLFLGNVGAHQSDARVFVDNKIYYIHPKFLEVVDYGND